MRKLFGTDGVRGVANSELTPELAFKLGIAAVHVLTKKYKHAPSILIGMDTRRSGHMLEASLVAGITSAGGDAVCAGIIPTPGIACLIKKYNLDAGAVISASHNPFLDNGIKFFNSEGYKFNDTMEEEIEKIVLNPTEINNISRPVGGKVGIRREATSAIADYIDCLVNISGGTNFSGLKVSMDCSNGAAYKAAPGLFQKLSAELKVIGDDPDGENINLRCGSTHIETLVEHVVKNNSDIGIAFDGDADRCLAVDENGNVVDGDQIMSVIGSYYKDKGWLEKNTIVTTVMSNLGFLKMGEEKGINIECTKVGDKYVLEKMIEQGYIFGGEQSGHIINLKYSTTGDGLLTALQLLIIMKETGKKLSELNVMEKFPQVLVNATVSNERKRDYLSSKEISNAISKLEEKFSKRGRVLIRPSGTEPLIRVMIEGKDIDEITYEAKKLASLLEDVLM